MTSQKKYNKEQLLTILAHEVAPKFLWTNNIRYENIKNEFITDATAIYAGFGEIMQNGCRKEETLGNTKKVSTIGYLEFEQIKYIRKLFCRAKVYQKTNINRYLSPKSILKNIIHQLKYVVKEMFTPSP